MKFKTKLYFYIVFLLQTQLYFEETCKLLVYLANFSKLNCKTIKISSFLKSKLICTKILFFLLVITVSCTKTFLLFILIDIQSVSSFQFLHFSWLNCFLNRSGFILYFCHIRWVVVYWLSGGCRQSLPEDNYDKVVNGFFFKSIHLLF